MLTKEKIDQNVSVSGEGNFMLNVVEYLQGSNHTVKINCLTRKLPRFKGQKFWLMQVVSPISRSTYYFSFNRDGSNWLPEQEKYAEFIENLNK